MKPLSYILREPGEDHNAPWINRAPWTYAYRQSIDPFPGFRWSPMSAIRQYHRPLYTFLSERTKQKRQ